MRYSQIVVDQPYILTELTRPETLTLNSFLRQKGFEVIGKGSFSSVYENPKFNYILKVFSEKDIGYITFLKYKPDLKCFPKVIGKPVKLNNDIYAVRIEKLSKDSNINIPILIEIIKTIYDKDKKKLNKIIKDKNYKNIYQYIIKDTDLISGIKFLRKMSKNNHSIASDLHPGNIMFRNNYPVIIDPFYAPGTKPIITDINLNKLSDILTYVEITGSKDPTLISALLKEPEYAYIYSKNIIKGRWPEAETFIMKDPRYAYFYADDVINGRFQEAEQYIMKDPRYAYFYATDVIKGRWEEAEPFIMTDPEWAYHYALDIIKGRWPEAEPFITKDKSFAKLYKYNIIGDKNS